MKLLKQLHISIQQCHIVTNKEGIIICLPRSRRDKPREYVTNWHSIYLLNATYKIGSVTKNLQLMISDQ